MKTLVTTILIFSAVLSLAGCATLPPPDNPNDFWPYRTWSQGFGW